MSDKYRNLFKFGDVAKYDRRFFHNSWFDSKARFMVLEDELPKEFSGVWIDNVSESLLSETWILYRLNDGSLQKAQIVKRLEDGEDHYVVYHLDDKSKEEVIVHRMHFVGMRIKEYILVPAKDKPKNFLIPRLIRSLSYIEPFYPQKIQLLSNLLNAPTDGHICDDRIVEWAKQIGLTPNVHHEDRTSWYTLSLKELEPSMN